MALSDPTAVSLSARRCCHLCSIAVCCCRNLQTSAAGATDTRHAICRWTNKKYDKEGKLIMTEEAVAATAEEGVAEAINDEKKTSIFVSGFAGQTHRRIACHEYILAAEQLHAIMPAPCWRQRPVARPNRALCCQGRQARGLCSVWCRAK